MTDEAQREDAGRECDGCGEPATFVVHDLHLILEGAKIPDRPIRFYSCDKCQVGWSIRRFDGRDPGVTRTDEHGAKHRVAYEGEES